MPPSSRQRLAPNSGCLLFMDSFGLHAAAVRYLFIYIFIYLYIYIYSATLAAIAPQSFFVLVHFVKVVVQVRFAVVITPTPPYLRNMPPTLAVKGSRLLKWVPTAFKNIETVGPKQN